MFIVALFGIILILGAITVLSSLSAGLFLMAAAWVVGIDMSYPEAYGISLFLGMFVISLASPVLAMLQSAATKQKSN